MDAHGVLVQFAQLVRPAHPGPPSPRCLCEAAVTIAGASGGAVTMEYSTSERITVAATDRLVHRLEDLQEVTGEGPGWEAHLTSEATSADLRDTTRWPLFTATALHEVGDVAVAAAPIHAGGSAVGVLGLYWAVDPLGAVSDSVVGRSQPPNAVASPIESFSRADLLDIMGLLGNLIGAFLATASEEEWERQLPWSHRASIHQATGMLVAQMRIAVHDAAAVLRAYAFSMESTLHEAAVSVLEQGRSFQLPPVGGVDAP